MVGQTQDWDELSEIGQAYGGISAILSGLALCAIGGSLLLQRRQAHLSAVTAARERHFDLVKLALDDPILRYPGIFSSSPEEARQWAYMNLWVSYWEMLWDTGAMSHIELCAQLDLLFSDNDAVAWWTASGPFWGITAATRRRRMFLATANEAFRRAASTRAKRIVDIDAVSQSDD